MLVFRKAVFAALAFLIGAGAAASQSLEARLSVLVHEGRVAEAMAVFEASDPTDAQRLFFAGRLAKAGKNYQRAAELLARHFRRIRPTSTRDVSWRIPCILAKTIPQRGISVISFSQSTATLRCAASIVRS